MSVCVGVHNLAICKGHWTKRMLVRTQHEKTWPLRVIGLTSSIKRIFSLLSDQYP